LDACGLIECSHRPANIAQHFRSIGDSKSPNGKSLIGGDGIKKTMVWRSARSLGTSQMRKRSLFGMPVPSAKSGFFSP